MRRNNGEKLPECRGFIVERSQGTKLYEFREEFMLWTSYNTMLRISSAKSVEERPQVRAQYDHQ